MPFQDLPLKPQAGDVDVHIGARLRGRRTMLGFSIQAVAARLELDPEIYAGYEAGRERIPAAALFAVTEVLRVPIRFVFDCYAAGPDAAKLWADHPVLPAVVRQT